MSSKNYKVFINYQDDDGYGQEASYLISVGAREDLDDVLTDLVESLEEEGFMYVDVNDVQNTSETIGKSMRWELLDTMPNPDYDEEAEDVDDDLHWSYEDDDLDESWEDDVDYTLDSDNRHRDLGYGTQEPYGPDSSWHSYKIKDPAEVQRIRKHNKPILDRIAKRDADYIGKVDNDSLFEEATSDTIQTLQIPEKLLDYTWDEDEPHLKDETFDRICGDDNYYIQEALLKNIIVEKGGIKYQIIPDTLVIDTYIQEEQPEGDEISEACREAILDYLEKNGLGKFDRVSWDITNPLTKAGFEWWICQGPDSEDEFEEDDDTSLFEAADSTITVECPNCHHKFQKNQGDLKASSINKKNT